MSESDFKVQVVEVKEVNEHPKADRLDLLKVLGWQCVAKKNEFSVGDKVVYIPIDSILPEELEAKIFGPDAKVKLSKHRVKTIKLRGAISQGMVVPTTYLKDKNAAIGTDVTTELGVTKYEPPLPKFQQGQSSPAKTTYKHPDFHKYHKWPNIKNYPELFKDEDEVVVTEKIHGTNFRAGWLKYNPNSLFKKIKMWLGLAPKWQFVYGSHNVQISEKLLYNGFYDKNVYAEAVMKYKLKKKIPKGILVYGEIYGASIQKGYNYGLEDSRELVLFDAQKDGKYVNHYDFMNIAAELEVPVAPVLYKGKYAYCDLQSYINGPSVLCPKQKVREGCVVKTIFEEECYAGSRKGTKCISEKYLLKDQSDFH